jgi:hypothetical protein
MAPAPSVATAKITLSFCISTAPKIDCRRFVASKATIPHAKLQPFLAARLSRSRQSGFGAPRSSGSAPLINSANARRAGPEACDRARLARVEGAMSVVPAILCCADLNGVESMPFRTRLFNRTTMTGRITPLDLFAALEQQFSKRHNNCPRFMQF